MVRILPAQDERVETGATQFGDDWPGVFIRGDNAFAYAMYIKAALQGGEDNVAQIYRSGALGLVRLLESCNANNAADAISRGDHIGEQHD